jgi:hypothetical protein
MASRRFVRCALRQTQSRAQVDQSPQVGAEPHSIPQFLNIRLDTGTQENTKKAVYVDMDKRINAILADQYSTENFKVFFDNMCLIIEY